MTRTAPDIDVAVIGGGAVGLAIARALAEAGSSVAVFERNGRLGEETSSRSSEVAHAGLYYPPGSLKARLCVEGNAKLSAFAADAGIPFKRCGKIVVASTSEELPKLQAIARNATACGVNDCRMLDAKEAGAMEPEISAVAGLLVPSTGIFDSHIYMMALEARLIDAGGLIVRRADVADVTREADGTFALDVAGDHGRVTARRVIAAAGHGMATLGPRLPHRPGYAAPKLRLAKGHYFALSRPHPFRHLIYPIPADGGLGVHLTFDITGRAKFGPDVTWVDRVDYGFEDGDGRRLAAFEEAIRRYWPGLPAGALAPDTTGVRPKLSGAGEPVADFAIHGKAEHGIDGLVALYGIESPGLTASPAIAGYVAAVLEA